MANPTHEIALTGCRPEPLASYLKALGILRLIAEQKDPDARGSWRGEHFVLRSTLDRDALLRFFLDEWKPTPVVAPWNGGSGFYPKDNREAPDAILASAEARLAQFAESIHLGRTFIEQRCWKERPADEDKALLISSMRATLPEAALAWLDAAIVLGDDRLLFPPLLGTGGNDGRLDFSNNFQQRVVQVLSARGPRSIESSLFGTALLSRFKGTMGQYQPAAHDRTNPWDFVLLLEGAMVFAAAATRRHEMGSSATLAFPFHARAASGIGTIVDDDEEQGRDELWLPLWSRPASLREVRRLFAEGRATVGAGDQARSAATALDFARAVTALGVDRGIDAFVRIGFLVRNGLAYFATPLGRFRTGDIRASRLLDDLDGWYTRFRNKASGGQVPARVVTARRALERAMFDAIDSGDVGPVLLGLGGAEQALARSLTFTSKAFLGPVPTLPARWASAAEDGSLEQRLGASLAARVGIRRRVLPLDRTGRTFGRADDTNCVFTERSLVDNLHALLARDDVESQQTTGVLPPLADAERCSLADIAQFIDGRTNDLLIEQWMRALLLVDGGLRCQQPGPETMPPASFAIIALAYHRRLGEAVLPRTTGLLSTACAGDAIGATSRAIRRLASEGRPVPVHALIEPVSRMRRIAAALAFPLTHSQRRSLEALVLPASRSSSAVILDRLQEQA